jgi:hypothetical protein
VLFAAPARPARATAKAAPKPEPETKPDTPPRIVNGQEVVSDEPDASPLTKVQGVFVPFRGRRVLTLADGSKTIGCADCDVTGTRGQIMSHRMEKHGARKSGARGGAKQESTPPDTSWMSLPIGDVIELAQRLGGFEADLDRERDRADAAEQARDIAERELRKIRRALEKAGFTVRVEDE